MSSRRSTCRRAPPSFGGERRIYDRAEATKIGSAGDTWWWWWGHEDRVTASSKRKRGIWWWIARAVAGSRETQATGYIYRCTFQWNDVHVYVAGQLYFFFVFLLRQFYFCYNNRIEGNRNYYLFYYLYKKYYLFSLYLIDVGLHLCLLQTKL